MTKEKTTINIKNKTQLQKLNTDNPQSCKDLIFKILEIMEDAERKKQKHESKYDSCHSVPHLLGGLYEEKYGITPDSHRQELQELLAKGRKQKRESENASQPPTPTQK